MEVGGHYSPQINSAAIWRLLYKGHLVELTAAWALSSAPDLPMWAVPRGAAPGPALLQWEPWQGRWEWSKMGASTVKLNISCRTWLSAGLGSIWSEVIHLICQWSCECWSPLLLQEGCGQPGCSWTRWKRAPAWDLLLSMPQVREAAGAHSTFWISPLRYFDSRFISSSYHNYFSAEYTRLLIRGRIQPNLLHVGLRQTKGLYSCWNQH